MWVRWVGTSVVITISIILEKNGGLRLVIGDWTRSVEYRNHYLLGDGGIELKERK